MKDEWWALPLGRQLAAGWWAGRCVGRRWRLSRIRCVAYFAHQAVLKESFDLTRRLSREKGQPGPEAELITLGMLPREVRPATSPVTGRQISPAVILLRACAARMRAAGASEFRLYTSAANHLACRLYRQLGFTELRRFPLFGEERICFVRSTLFSDPL